jgi:hypothetical protein
LISQRSGLDIGATIDRFRRRADKIPGGYVVRDANGQALAYVYSRDSEPEALQAKVLTKEIALAANLRTLIQAPRRFVFGIPTLYARFRREALRGGRHFVRGTATVEFLNGNRISPDELDVLILIMLPRSSPASGARAAPRPRDFDDHNNSRSAVACVPPNGGHPDAPGSYGNIDYVGSHQKQPPPPVTTGTSATAFRPNNPPIAIDSEGPLRPIVR